MPFGTEAGLRAGPIVLDGVPAPAPPQKGGHNSPQFSAHVCFGQTAGWIKMPLGTELGLGPGAIMLDGDPAPPKGHTPILGPCLLWSNGRPSQLVLSTCLINQRSNTVTATIQK